MRSSTQKVYECEVTGARRERATKRVLAILFLFCLSTVSSRPQGKENHSPFLPSIPVPGCFGIQGTKAAETLWQDGSPRRQTGNRSA